MVQRSGMTRHAMRALAVFAIAGAVSMLAPHVVSAAVIKTTFTSSFAGEAGAGVEEVFPFSTQPGGENRAIATVEVVGLEDVEFSMFDAEPDGTAEGSAIASVDGEGTLDVTGLAAGENFLLRLGGIVAADLGAGTGLIEGFVVTADVPIAPALLMLLTGIGALFGFAGMRKMRRQPDATQ